MHTECTSPSQTLTPPWPLFALAVWGFQMGRGGTLQATAHSCTDRSLLEQVSKG